MTDCQLLVYICSEQKNNIQTFIKTICYGCENKPFFWIIQLLSEKSSVQPWTSCRCWTNSDSASGSCEHFGQLLIGLQSQQRYIPLQNKTVICYLLFLRSLTGKQREERGTPSKNELWTVNISAVVSGLSVFRYMKKAPMSFLIGACLFFC